MSETTATKPYAFDVRRCLAPGADRDNTNAAWIAVCAINRDDLADNMDVLTDAVNFARRRFRMDSHAGYDKAVGPTPDDGHVKAPLIQDTFAAGPTTAAEYLQSAAEQNVASRAGVMKGYILYVRVTT